MEGEGKEMKRTGVELCEAEDIKAVQPSEKPVERLARAGVVLAVDAADEQQRVLLWERLQQALQAPESRAGGVGLRDSDSGHRQR